MIKCTNKNCGAINPDGAIFCSVCGNKIRQNNPLDNPLNNGYRPTSLLNTKVTILAKIIIFCVLVDFVFVCLVTYCFFNYYKTNTEDIYWDYLNTCTVSFSYDVDSKILYFGSRELIEKKLSFEDSVSYMNNTNLKFSPYKYLSKYEIQKIQSSVQNSYNEEVMEAFMPLFILLIILCLLFYRVTIIRNKHVEYLKLHVDYIKMTLNPIKKYVYVISNRKYGIYNRFNNKMQIHPHYDEITQLIYNKMFLVKEGNNKYQININDNKLK